MLQKIHFFKKNFFSKARRVVVTGLGIVSPVGNSPDSFWNNIINKQCGIRPIEESGNHFNSKIPSRVAGIVQDFSLSDYITGDELHEDIIERRLSKNLCYSIAASLNALKDYEGDDIDAFRNGCCIGTGLGSLEEVQNVNELLSNDKYKSITPFAIIRILQNMSPAYVGINNDLKGANFSLNSACSTGGMSIGMGFNLIRFNQADMMVVGGTESSINEICLSSFCRINALSTKYNDTPLLSSRPFDRNRDGFVVGEGAGVLVLEELEHALKRDANILAEIRGFSSTCDAHKLTKSDPEGLGQIKAMEQCIEESGLEKNMIQYVNCHATSTPSGDEVEYKAISEVFKNDNVDISSIKGATGHLLGASGAVESIATVMAIQNQTIPPNINFEEADFELNKNAEIVNEPKKKEIFGAISNSFGFGGTNNSILFTKFEN